MVLGWIGVSTREPLHDDGAVMVRDVALEAVGDVDGHRDQSFFRMASRNWIVLGSPLTGVVRRGPGDDILGFPIESQSLRATRDGAASAGRLPTRRLPELSRVDTSAAISYRGIRLMENAQSGVADTRVRRPETGDARARQFRSVSWRLVAGGERVLLRRCLMGSQTTS